MKNESILDIAAPSRNNILSSRHMSELGNKIAHLRGSLSLKEFADKAGLSWSLIAKLEKGQVPRLATVQLIAQKLKLKEADRTDLVLAWIKAELGPEAKHFWIDPKKPAELLKDKENIPHQVAGLVSALPTQMQAEILNALQRPEVLKSVKHLNELYDRVRKAAS